MTEIERLEKYVDHLKDLIVEAEAQLKKGVPDNERFHIMEQIVMHYKLMQGAYESVVIGRRESSRRNKGQTQLGKQRQHFLRQVARSANTTKAKLIARHAFTEKFVAGTQDLWPNTPDDEIEIKILNLAGRMTVKELRKS